MGKFTIIKLDIDDHTSDRRAEAPELFSILHQNLGTKDALLRERQQENTSNSKFPHCRDIESPDLLYKSYCYNSAHWITACLPEVWAGQGSKGREGSRKSKGSIEICARPHSTY